MNVINALFNAFETLVTQSPSQPTSARSPQAIIVVGLEGSGYEVFAQRLAELLCLPFIATMRYRLCCQCTGCCYCWEFQSDYIKSVADRLKAIRENNEHVVVSCSALTPAERSILASACPAIFIGLQVSDATMLARIGGYRLRFTRDVVRYRLPAPSEFGIVVNGDQPVEVAVQEFLRRVVEEPAFTNSLGRPTPLLQLSLGAPMPMNPGERRY